MSLIQVSSSQLQYQDKSQFKYEFNKGYSFSNFFNNLLDIPPNSEIALHSGQFKVKNTSQYDFTTLSNDKEYYNFRVLFAPEESSYSTNETTKNSSSHNPLLFYMPQEKFFNIESVWTKISKILSLSSIPELSKTNFQITKSIVNNEINIQLSVSDLNVGDTDYEALDSSSCGFQSIKNQIILDDETIIKNSGGSQAYNGDIFYTNFNGIHNIKGGIVFDNLYSNKLQTSKPYPNLFSQHTMCLGVKRFEQDFWKTMNEVNSYNYLNSSLQSKWIHYLYELGGLPKSYVSEYFFIIRGRVSAIQGEKPVLKSEPVIDIIKFEILNGIPRLVCICTGDSVVNSVYEIPYSALLDPQSDTWIEYGERNCVIGDEDNISAKLEIAFESNKVLFYSFDQQISVSQSPSTISSPLELELSDVVFPLQAYGLITGQGDNLEINITPLKEDGQIIQKNYGELYSDFNKYIVNDMMIPSGIYNKNATQNSPCFYYPTTYESGYPERQNPIVFDDISEANTMIGNIFIGVGTSESTDMKINRPNESVLNPNIKDKLGLILPVFKLESDLLYTSYNGLYTPRIIEYSPFLSGIYIRLKNLPNKTTMGSINSADSDKLISVINRYDYTENQIGSEYPIYTYNEYEKLYISLNNPNTIQVNKLDFDLVDKFGNMITSVSETTLVLHIRPAQYKDYFKSSYQ